MQLTKSIDDEKNAALQAKHSGDIEKAKAHMRNYKTLQVT
jgi:hypothetical protein